MLAPGQTGILLLRTLSHFVLTMIPCFAAASFAAWRGARGQLVLGLAGLVGIAANGYFAFWLWFFSPRVGHAVSFLLPILEIAWLLWSGAKLDPPARADVKSLALPAALVLCASLLVLSAGFAYGGLDKPIETPWTRFSHRLPPDNLLPFLFAEEVRIGHIYKPFFEGGHSSDRPPLQAAIALSQYPFLPQPRALGYTALAAILQSLWIYAVWLLLRAFHIDARAVTLAFLVTLFSGFTFLNTFFVWPKLLAAAFMLAFSILLLVDNFAAKLARDLPLMILAGALLAFGLLSHGASAFAVIGMILAAAALRRRLPFKSIAVVCGAAFVLYLPWLLYQRLVDPPGDALLKLHLAGVDHPTDGPFLPVLAAAYRSLTPHIFFENKIANARWIFDYEKPFWGRVLDLCSAALRGRSAEAAAAAFDLRSLSFFHFVPNLGFLVAGALAFIAGVYKRSPAWRVSARLWLLVGCILVPWCLLMFKPESTSIHQGSYVAVLLAFSAAVLALWSIAPLLAIAVAVLEIALNVVIYVVFMPPPNPGLLAGELAIFIAASLGLLSLLWFCADRRKSPPWY
jgi:hypothetical protein